MIEVPQTAIELAKRFEGFERKVKRGIEITAVPYICPAGFWTIGYGHLCDPRHPPITEAEAEVYLARDLQTALSATLRFCPVLATEPEGRLAAIVDFTFNLGAGRLQTSTLRRRPCKIHATAKAERSTPVFLALCAVVSAAANVASSADSGAKRPLSPRRTIARSSQRML